jgi:hypothetical protein
MRSRFIACPIPEVRAAVDLPYGGGAWSMTVVVPRGDNTVDDLVTSLDPAAWDALVDGVIPHEPSPGMGGFSLVDSPGFLTSLPHPLGVTIT